MGNCPNMSWEEQYSGFLDVAMGRASRISIRLLGCGNGEGIKNIYSSHKDCGFNCSPISQILHCQTNQLATMRLDIDNFSGREIPVSERNFDKIHSIFMKCK